MRKIKEILRLKWVCGLSIKAIAGTCSLARSSVSKYVHRAEEAGLSWQAIESMSEEELERRVIFFPPNMNESRVMPDFHDIHTQLKRKGVTLQLLWEEYKQENTLGLQYSQFCQVYRDWREQLDLPMHQNHKAGEKMFVDYCGQTMPLTDRETGKTREVQIFVAVLGASNYTYAEAFLSQSLPEWITAHVHAFHHFGGVPDQVIPDNLKSGITVANRYEPELNRTYEEFARHYGCAIIPARVRKPRDKAKVEKGVQDVERRILAPLRNRVFFALPELNQEIELLLKQHNERPFQKIPGSRWSLFQEIEKSTLRPLPLYPFEYAEWKKARVNIDYHIDVYGHYYSVPYQLVNQSLDVRITVTTIECFHRNKRVSSHLRSTLKGQYSTTTEHMPKRHQEYAKWTPERLIQWAEKTGPETKRVVEHIIASRPHPQQGFRACLGLMRLGKEFGPERLESACRRAWTMNVVGFKSIDSILKRNLDQQPIPEKVQERPPLDHDNIRGPEYYR
jgi:transposase